MLVLKKLAIAAAVAMLSSQVFAMDIVADDDLSETTGQDGISVGITLPVSGLSFSTIMHDSDGWVGATSAGGLIIGDPRNAGGSYVKTKLASAGEIMLNIDSTGDIDPATPATKQAAVKINITLGSALTITTGTLSVAASNGLGVALNTAPVDQTAPFLNSMDITIGAGSLMDIYLGNEPVGGHMIDINTSLTGGLTIANFSLNDTGGTVTGGSISATQIKMCDTNATAACGATNLQIKANIDVASTAVAPVAPAAPATGGLILTLAQVGTTSGMDVEVTGLKFGSALTPAIGNVDIVGLALGNNAADFTKIRIVGH